jgi:hypothetical protein
MKMVVELNGKVPDPISFVAQAKMIEVMYAFLDLTFYSCSETSFHFQFVLENLIYNVGSIWPANFFLVSGQPTIVLGWRQRAIFLLFLLKVCS